MLRRQVYTLLIVLSIAVVCGRLMSTVRNYEPPLFRDDPGQSAAAIVLPLAASSPLESAMLTSAGANRWDRLDPREARPTWPKTRPNPVPTFGSNDRSRWATIRSLVDHGTYIVGYRERDPATKTYRDWGIINEDGWQSVDKVLHPEPLPGQPNVYPFYSSKPPLLPTILAGEYWLLKHGLGLEFAGEDRWAITRIILLTVNVLPLAIYFFLLSRLADRYGTTDWARLFVVAAACFGTFLTLFAITLNNHTVAACTALFALVPFLRAWSEKDAPGWTIAVCGFFAAFTAAVELPAASLGAALFGLLMWRTPRRTLLWFVPAAAIPVAAAFATNYLALGRLTPAYSEHGTGAAGTWYNYEGSHWDPDPAKEKRGIDWAGEKESRGEYAVHALIGHHGVFSLSPVLLLAMVGMGWGAKRLLSSRKVQSEATAPESIPDAEQSAEGAAVPAVAPTPISDLPLIASLTLVLTVVVTGFYLYKTSNYGGWTNGLRWLFWLTPLWLLSMLPVVDWLAGRRWGRGLACVLLGASIFSASYRDWNPWRHPWIYQAMETQRWIPY